MVVHNDNEEVQECTMSNQNAKRDESAKVAMKESEERWSKPMKCVPMEQFCKKCNKSAEKSKRAASCMMGDVRALVLEAHSARSR